MTNTQRYAKRELDILVKSATDPGNRPIVEPFIPEILALCEKFGNSGQSGGSAPSTATALAQTVKKLLLQEPICPIMGIDEEWIDVAHLGDGLDILWQNARCSCLFKGINGRAWYLDAIVWKGDKTGTFTGPIQMGEEVLTSRQYVKRWPFTPKTFYIDVVDREVSKDRWDHSVKDPRQLKAVFKYYDRYAQPESKKTARRCLIS